MIWPVYLFYLFCILIIRILKFFELCFIKLLFPLFRARAYRLAESVGIVLHDATRDKEWTQADNERVLSKCPYDTLVHISIKDSSFFTRSANLGTLGVGECYMDGGFEVGNCLEDITETGKRWFENDMMYKYYWNRWNRFLNWVELLAFNLQTKPRAFQVIKKHYHLGDDLYQQMLDPYMQYTCAYWKDAANLNAAQINKMELIAKKLDLKPGMRVLDIGCGWGTLCKYLAEHYDVECVGVTIAEEAVKYGQRVNKGLKVDIRLCDYRDVNEKFDRVVSIGLMEHVGPYNYSEFFKVARNCLTDDGIFLCHTIGLNHGHQYPGTDAWSHKYIFPNGYTPKPMEICKNTEGLFVIEDWHNFGPDYAKTLHAWRENFQAAWPNLQEKYDERFYRMWVLYLSMSKALFASRKLQLWQIVLTKDGLKREYRAAR